MPSADTCNQALCPERSFPCGEAKQNTEHFLQTCKLHQAQREKTWDKPTPITEKMYGPLEDLQKTAKFVEETGEEDVLIHLLKIENLNGEVFIKGV